MKGSIAAHLERRAGRTEALDTSRPAGLLVGAVVLVPLLLVPYGFNPYAASSLALFLIYGLLAMSLNFIWGYAGIISFGQNAFFGVGAYAYGIIALNVIGPSGNTGLAVLGGIGTPALLSLFFAYFMFYGRLSDVYASIVVLVLSLVLYSFAVSTAGDEWVIGVARLGGFNGLFGQGSTSGNIANFQIPPITLPVPGMSEPFAFRINRTNVSGYYLVLGTCVGVFLFASLLLRTRLGRVAVAIRENEARAVSLGYDIRLYKLAMFTLAGAMAGIAGVLFASWGRFVNPDVFNLTFAASVVVAVLLGGRLTLLGGFVGAVAINYLTSYLGGLAAGGTGTTDTSTLPGMLLEIAGRMAQQAPILVPGVVLICTVLILKEGITPPLLRQLARRPLIGWLVLFPAVGTFFVLKVACRQAEVCLF